MTRRAVTHELRISWSLVATPVENGDAGDDRLVVDAELLTEEEGIVTSEVLAIGRTIWPGGAWENHEHVHVPLTWLLTGTPADWPLRPSGLDQGGSLAQRTWGTFVADAVRLAIGPDRLDALVDASSEQAHVRIVFHARDRRIARVPVETFHVVRGGEPVTTVSILRTPSRLNLKQSVPAFSSSPTYNSLAVQMDPADPATRDPAAHIGHGADLRRAVAAPAPVRGYAALCEASGGGLGDADLALIAGQGEAGLGITAENGSLVDASALAGTIVARAGHRPPTVVIVASCGSAEHADGGRSAERALAEHVAEAGIALTIGFQGATVGVDQAFHFVQRLSAAWTATFLASGDRTLDLQDWELAIQQGRGRGADPAAVAFVHPSLLLGRRPSGRARSAVRRSGTKTTIPFYVPAQLAWVRDAGDPERLLRFPLPVDVGVRLTVRLSDDPPSRHSFLEGDLQRLQDAWSSLRGRHLDVQLAPESAKARALIRNVNRVFDHAACWSAELAATIRAIESITGEPMPSAVGALLDAAVKDGAGTPDAMPRLIDHETGQRAHELTGGWPRWTVRLKKLHWQPPRLGARALPDDTTVRAHWRDGTLLDHLREQHRELFESVPIEGQGGDAMAAVPRVALIAGHGAERGTPTDAPTIVGLPNDLPAASGGVRRSLLAG